MLERERFALIEGLPRAGDLLAGRDPMDDFVIAGAFANRFLLVTVMPLASLGSFLVYHCLLLTCVCFSGDSYCGVVVVTWEPVCEMLAFKASL